MGRDIKEIVTAKPVVCIATTTATSSSNTGNSREVKAKPDPVLATCRCFSIVTVVAAILCIVANVISAFKSFRHGLDIFDVIFRIYAVLIGAVVVVAETELSFIAKFWKVLDYWVGRGILQIFVAVMTRAYPDLKRERHEISLLRDIASYMLLACGFIYVISGFFCLGFLKRARQHKEVSTAQATKDLEELERKRAELEALLIIDPQLAK